LRELLPTEVMGLLADAAARVTARRAHLARGRARLLGDQTARFSGAVILITGGEGAGAAALSSRRFGPYTLRRQSPGTCRSHQRRGDDWAQMSLYDVLLHAEPSPVVQLTRRRRGDGGTAPRRPHLDRRHPGARDLADYHLAH